MIRRPPRSTQGVSSAASDVYKRQSFVSSEALGESSILTFYSRSIRMRVCTQHQCSFVLRQLIVLSSIFHVQATTIPVHRLAPMINDRVRTSLQHTSARVSTRELSESIYKERANFVLRPIVQHLDAPARQQGDVAEQLCLCILGWLSQGFSEDEIQQRSKGMNHRTMKTYIASFCLGFYQRD